MQEPRIPIQNLYFLLCYSWDQLEQGELVDVSRCSSSDLADLFTLVLSDGVKHLARRGLEQGYDTQTDELSSLRGRIDAYGSARRFLPFQGKAICHFDELTGNTLNNQILKATLRSLSSAVGLDESLRREAVKVYKSLHGIDDVEVSLQTFRRVQLHSNTRFYKFLLNVCEFVHTASMIDSKTGGMRFRDFIRDERAMARVFEHFLFNFIRKEVNEVVVKRDRIAWQASSLSDPDLNLLPSMNTDISVTRGGARLIIDAKYYANALSSYWDTSKLHSHNLYQLMSYLTNYPSAENESLSGMLIYPRVDRNLRERYLVQGYPVSICTVDLNQHWKKVHEEIIELTNWAFEAMSTEPAAAHPAFTTVLKVGGKLGESQLRLSVNPTPAR